MTQGKGKRQKWRTGVRRISPNRKKYGRRMAVNTHNIGDVTRGNWCPYEYRRGLLRFVENTQLIQRLLGTLLYEWKYADGWYFIRRAA